MSGFLSLCSARFAMPVKLATIASPENGGRADVFVGSDADYAATGLPQRRKTQFHWLGAWDDEAGVDCCARPGSFQPCIRKRAKVITRSASAGNISAGAFLGNRYLTKLTMVHVQRIVAGLLLAVGLGLIAGVV